MSLSISLFDFLYSVSLLSYIVSSLGFLVVLCSPCIWELAIQGTWGAVLVEDGDVDTGLSHLFQAAEHNMIPHNRAINFAYSVSVRR